MLNRLSSQAVPMEIQNKLDIFFGDLKEVGIAYLGHGVVSDQGDHTGYFSNKSWGEIYIQNKYFFVEPILKNYKNQEIDVISWTALEDVRSIARTRNEFVQLGSGMTICKRDNAFNTFFNIGFNKDVDIIRFSFLKRDILLAYFTIFNSCHLSWRKQKSF